MWSPWRFNSRGYLKDPPAQHHPKILFGPGAYLTPEFAKQYNIKYVINCAQEEHSPTWFKTEFPENYVCLNAEDSESVQILKWYPKFSKSMNTFLEGKGCVYVHCQAGINRSGFLYLAYLCLEHKYNIQVLEKSIIKQRPCALTNKAFRKQVYQKVSDNYNGKSWPKSNME
jgi:protein-tyrosine phosphatase